MSVPDLVSQLHRYSVDEYDELVELGAFEGQHVELIEGLVLDMSPKSPRHELAVRWLLNKWILRTLDSDRHEFAASGSLRLGTSEPEPDIAIIDADWGLSHPTSASLVIEVALSSRERDLTLKPRLYAPAVAEYWVIDLSNYQVVVHRDPGTDGYRDVSVHDRDSELRPQRAALGPLRLSELFRAV
jgi:Uma2 family endonuclease